MKRDWSSKTPRHDYLRPENVTVSGLCPPMSGKASPFSDAQQSLCGYAAVPGGGASGFFSVGKAKPFRSSGGTAGRKSIERLNELRCRSG
jgi:hypothetical protein